MANDSVYGLCAAIWTTNLKRAHITASKLETGIVWVNSWFLRDLRTPFGGIKLSGIGREEMGRIGDGDRQGIKTIF